VVNALRLRVALRDIEPEIWRLLDIAPDTTLDRLHELLQTAMGWEDAHLHMFEVGDTRYGIPDEVIEHDEQGVRVTALPQKFVYSYDFGDGWEHDLEVIGLVEAEAVPGVVDGARACPPEDCGGPFGYGDFLDALDDERHPRHAELLEWCGGHEPEAFDAAATTALLRITAGISLEAGPPPEDPVPPSVRLLLRLLDGGVRLTPGGRLPRSVVRAVQEERPSWGWDPDRPARIEEDLQTLAALHDLLRAAGLLRLARGVLTPTKASRDDKELLRRLRDTVCSSDWAGVLRRYVLERLGPIPVLESVLAQGALRALGSRYSRDGRPVGPSDVRRGLGAARHALIGLDALEESGRWTDRAWRSTAHTRVLLR
jgi:Plasmid pRiA4b ORF-3-like protein